MNGAKNRCGEVNGVNEQEGIETYVTESVAILFQEGLDVIEDLPVTKCRIGRDTTT